MESLTKELINDPDNDFCEDVVKRKLTNCLVIFLVKLCTLLYII